MKQEAAIAVMRWEVLLRDGRDCVPCCIVGYCDAKGRGWCSGIRLVSPDLNLATYKKLDALRRGNASLRLHLSHLRTKSNEGWRDLVASCPCHNDRVTTHIKEVCLAYTVQFPEEGTELFERALDRRGDEKAEMKASYATARRSQRQRTNAKLGRTRSTSKLPSKVEDQRARPVFNGTTPT